jgi:Carboxypeptidase regulatory-like domain
MIKAIIAICILVTALCSITASGQTSQSGEAKIIGKVIERETLQPLSAEIAIAGRDQRNLFLRHSRASADGLFEISDLPAGELHLTTKLDGYAAEHLSVSLNNGESRYLEFYLIKGRTVRGVVRDQMNTPISGARVNVIYTREATDASSLTASYQWEKEETVTDQTGQFELRDIHPEQEFAVEASHPKYPGRVTEPFRFRAQTGELSLNLSLGRGLSVSGVVRDADGNILRGARAMLFSESPGEPTINTISNDDGTFTFDQVKPAKKTIVVLHPGYQPYRQIIDFTDPQARLSINVVLQPQK